MAFANQGGRGFRHAANLTGKDILRLARGKIRSAYLRLANDGQIRHGWLSDIDVNLMTQINEKTAGDKELDKDAQIFLNFRLALLMKKYTLFEQRLLKYGAAFFFLGNAVSMYLCYFGFLSQLLGASLGIGSLLTSAGCYYGLFFYSSDDAKTISRIFEDTASRFQTREIPRFLFSIDPESANILNSWAHELKLKVWANSLPFKYFPGA